MSNADGRQELPPAPFTMKEKLIAFLSLFTSTGTLLCCALPATLAAVAGGAAVGTLVTAFPWLIPLSRHKGWLFLFAGTLILANGALTFRPQGTLACAVTGGKGCEVAGTFGRVMFWAAAGIYGVGFFFAYLLAPILRFLD